MDVLSIALPIMGLFAATQPDFQLRQEIEPIICTTTTMALSRVHVTGQSTCDESYAPTLTEIIADDGRLIFKGRFDANQMRMFRINVFGVWYTLGSSQYFTTSGNDWTLDLSHLSDSIASGVYTITIEMLTNDGFFYQDTFQSSITITFPEEPTTPPVDNALPDEPGDESRAGGGELADTGQNVFLFVALGVAMIAAAGMLLVKARHAKNK